MGLDLFIERRKKNDTNAPWVELFYARKFWDLLHASFVREYNDRHKADKPTTEELLVKALNVSQARKENDEFKVRRAKR